jgi:hypothetical protein
MKKSSFLLRSAAIFLGLPVLLLTSVHAQPQPAEFTVGEFTFLRPGDWTWVQPSSAMRKAELSVPGEPGPAEVTFFHFGPGQGGTAQANIERWLGQFVEPIPELNAHTAEQEINGTKVVLLQARGTFLAGMPGQTPKPMKNYAMRGAILASEEGDVYIKMTGPADVVETAGPAFDQMVAQAAGAN